MIPLETIQIAKPCSADWNEMTGDAQVRHCGSCRLNVYNLSEMTRAEAEAVILQHEGHLCVRFYTRADGTVLTQDCPVGVRAFRLKAARKLSWAAALVVSCLTGLWRGETARAVTQSAAKTPPKDAAPAGTHKAHISPKPHPTPQALMGKPALPPHGWTMGAPPPPPAMMGKISPIPPPPLKPHHK